MENATKALLIAAAVFIAIAMLTIFVILYNMYSNYADNYKEQLSVAELQKFNSEFEVFVGRTDIKAHEIVTLYNLINENGYNVTIIIGSTPLSISNDEEYISNKDGTYTYTGLEYDNDGKVMQIKFSYTSP